MNTLRAIRQRLNSIKNIKQLTKAMEMVAASRLHMAQIRAKMSQPYISKINEIIGKLSEVATDFSHPFFEQREVKKTGLVIIASDTGLCGAYNREVFTAANHFLKNTQPDKVELILIGRKAVNYYRQRKWPIAFQMIEWGEKLTFQQIRALSNQLVTWYLERQLDEIWFIYTHYISIMSRHVVTKKFLNIETLPEKKNSTDYIFEPNVNAVYSEILAHYCLTTIQTALKEAYASELAARLFAMKAATKNADEMIEKLTGVRNKVRQAGITKEMIEITSGGR